MCLAAGGRTEFGRLVRCFIASAMETEPDPSDKLRGLLLGTAAADAIGLPREGLSARRALRLFGPPPLGHRFLFGRGMASDDTENACMTAQALLSAPEDVEAFSRSLAWRFRGWLLGLPVGIGWATLRAILKLWLGWPPERSGVASAGNGPAMRAPVLGACLGADPDRLAAYVRASTRMTHTDPRAEQGALIIARAAWLALRHPPGTSPDPLDWLASLLTGTKDSGLRSALGVLSRHLAQGDSPAEAARGLGLRNGVGGYIYETVPMALYCWLRHPEDFRRAVEEVVLLGGDTDTTAAITGALAGATLGVSRIPRDWTEDLVEWPRSAAWIRTLADRLTLVFHGRSLGAAAPLPLLWPAFPLRNAVFAAVVLAHGLRRLAPPY